jgi:Phosphofructokinase
MTHNFTAADLAVKSLGPCRIDSPLLPMLDQRQRTFHNVDEEDRVLFDDTLSSLCERNVPIDQLPAFEPAGPRRKIFFDPSKARAAIVTCGGLCPGFNDVIRSLVLELSKGYGVRKVYGFCNGYQGFIAKYRRPVLDLSVATVAGINEQGGTTLGTSRGEQDPAEIVDCMETMSINMLFVIGGRRHPAGRATNHGLYCRARREDRGGGRSQDHRQRHHVHRPELRLSDRRCRSHARDPLRARRSGILSQRHRPG